MMRRSPGFTLTESLVAVTLYAAVMTGILTAFGSGIFCHNQVGERLDFFQAKAQVISRMDLDARNALVYSKHDSMFSGRRDAVSFFAEIDTFQEGKPRRDVAFISYRFSGGRLLRIRRPGKEGLKEEAPGETDELWLGIRAGAFQYADNISPEKAIVWRDTWEDSESLPQAVKVDITPEDDPHRRMEHVIYLRV